MAIQAGTYELGPHNASLTVRTGRGGAAAKAGHDLTLEVASWQATLEVGDDPRLELTADPTSLQVRSGTGGMKALDDGDRDDIRATIDKEVLERKPIAFRSSSVRADGDVLHVDGELELGGSAQPISFDLTESGGTLTGEAVVTQSAWGIKPYSALFGALKVADDVRVAVEARLG